MSSPPGKFPSKSSQDSLKALRKPSEGWSVDVGVRIARQGATVLEEGVANVLTALDRTNSISSAARSLGISYRHAWLLVQQANDAAGRPLVATAIGGQRGGGTELTEFGRAALSLYRRVQEQMDSAATDAIPRNAELESVEASVIHLAAAISLQEVIALVINEYAEVRPAISIRTTFGASNELADQIAAGSPADVFISASRNHIVRLARSGHLDARSRRPLATNGLAVVSNQIHIRKVGDLLRTPYTKLVVADSACPLGMHSKRFLEREGLFDELRPRIRFVDNSRAVVASMRTSSPRVGIIFGSDVANAVGVTSVIKVPTSKAKAIYEEAVIKRSGAITAARELVQYFSSARGRECFRACGLAI